MSLYSAKFLQYINLQIAYKYNKINLKNLVIDFQIIQKTIVFYLLLSFFYQKKMIVHDDAPSWNQTFVMNENRPRMIINALYSQPSQPVPKHRSTIRK